MVLSREVFSGDFQALAQQQNGKLVTQADNDKAKLTLALNIHSEHG